MARVKKTRLMNCSVKKYNEWLVAQETDLVKGRGAGQVKMVIQGKIECLVMMLEYVYCQQNASWEVTVESEAHQA